MNQRTGKPITSQAMRRGALARKLLRAAKRQARRPLPSLPPLCDDNKTVISKPTKVYGPYCDGSQWRLVVLDGGTRKAFVYPTESAACEVRDSLSKALDNRASKGIGETVDEYLAHKRDMGLVERTLRTCRDRLLPFLPADEPLSGMTPERAESLYREHTKTVAAATHHKTLRASKALFGYCVQRKYIALNPFAEVRPIGKANAGKPQLRQDEAKLLSDYLVAEASGGDVKALALLVQVLLGLRSAEVLKLRKRDFDCEGTVVWVDGTKNKNAKRRLGLESSTVRELLARRVATLASHQLVFAPDDRDSPLPTDSLYKALAKFCERAGVPQVCPHSLRGLHSSLAVQVGITSAAVAQALGHASDAVTRRHYIAESALDSARSQSIATALLGDRDLDSLRSTLQALPSVQLERLCASLGFRR